MAGDIAEPLAGVVADLSRYSKRKIVIRDEAAGQVEVTGVVFERNIDQWLKSLEAALPVEVKEDEDGTVEIGTPSRK
jgi:ferric-dicitrate binding protein FerR (iron transport regulator)